MSKQSKTLPKGIAIIVNDDGILQKIIHDSYGLSSLHEDEMLSFVDFLESDSIPKGYQFIERVKTKDVAYNWELHVANDDRIKLFSFSGIRLDDENLLIGTTNANDTEQFLNGLMEMNNETVNKLRTFMKEQQRLSGKSQNNEWSMYDQMSGLNNQLANMQRKLSKRTAELKRLNELKDQMLGMAAHDLRSPLTLIQNFTIFLIEDHEEDNFFTDDQFKMVKQIKESSEYMVQIVEDWLDMSAIESGKVSLDKTEVDMIELMEKVVSLNHPPASKKDIAMTLELPQNPIIKEIDSHKFQQVLNNLISNAIKYSHSNTTVTMGIEQEEEGSGITIFVKDEGQGIPEDDLDDLFVPFVKKSVQGTGGEKSTGLGLAIAQKLPRHTGVKSRWRVKWVLAQFFM
ncbi:MAG: HAMP domain-containing sensor histidine kinase [Balneolaceae bacterium]|nr:HAMP domain-containing sensor histidine kinase [Balneolaceae bacterium]